MRTYDYEQRYKELLQPDIVSLVVQIHEYKGEQILFTEAKADILTQLVETAKLQSIEASNKIEGIYTSDERLKKIVRDKTRPKTRNEKEIAGYRDVLNTIHDNHDYIPVKASIMLQLHRELNQFAGESGGIFKHIPSASAWEVSENIDAICGAFEESCTNKDCDSLLVIPMFILDFLCIAPFDSDNGRMSRLLTLLLLYRAGYIVGKYVSIEKLIEQTKGIYDEALRESSLGWHEGKNDYAPFVRYMLGVIDDAYREFSCRIQALSMSGLSKPERIREIMRNAFGRMTKAELMERCPDISQTTIQRTLNDLVKSGVILKIGGGRYTAYVWNREEE